MEPYRHASELETLSAETREGKLQLEVAPRYVALSLGLQKVTVTEEFVSVESVEKKKKNVKRRSLKLGESTLFVARGYPRDDLSLWFQTGPARVQRVFGVRPPELLDDAAMGALRDLNRLTNRLRSALADRASTVSGLEVGDGADRVLVGDYGDRFEVYVRRLFRSTAKRMLAVYDDGSIIVPTRTGERKVVCRSRFGITVIGDYVRFSDPSGEDLVRLAIPWITPQDRRELARRFGQMIDAPLPVVADPGEITTVLGQAASPLG